MIRKVIKLLEKDHVICAETVSLKLSINKDQAKYLIQILIDQGVLQTQEKGISNPTCINCSGSCVAGKC